MTAAQRHALVGILALLVALGALLLSLRPWEAPPAAAAVTFPTRVQAVADEYRFTLSRVKVPSGKVKIELANFGEDPHNLKLRRIGGTTVHTVGETLPGERTVKTFKLQAGQFKLWCSLAGHEALGMKATLRVVKRKS
jgi:plastocyanin